MCKVHEKKALVKDIQCLEVPMDECRDNQRGKEQGLDGNLGGEGEGLPEGCAEGVYDVERQHAVPKAQTPALQENDLETLLEQIGKSVPKLDRLELEPIGSNAPACPGKRVC